MVRCISDRVKIMHVGHIYEMGAVTDVYNNSMQPYTQSIVSAMPQSDPVQERSCKRFIYNISNLIYNHSQMKNLSDNHSVLIADKDIEMWSKGDHSLITK